MYNSKTLTETTQLLSLNPEFNAVWNYRRDIFVSLILLDQSLAVNLLGEDLQLVKTMMREYPKCYWIWNHRRWCLEELSKNHMADWTYELGLILKVLQTDSRNFHGWHYRRYVVASMENELKKSAENPQLAELNLCLNEYKYATSKIEKDISNFSAWHNRSKLIPRIFALIKALIDVEKSVDSPATVALFETPLKLLHHELDLVKTGIFMDSADTSVWLFMQWLLTDDIFVGQLRKLSKDAYLQILTQQLSNVQELNELEKDDSLTKQDNVACLKMIVFIRALVNAQVDKPALDENICICLSLLTRLDPLRAGRYQDQLSGITPLTC